MEQLCRVVDRLRRGVHRTLTTVQVLDDASADTLIEAFALWAADLH